MNKSAEFLLKLIASALNDAEPNTTEYSDIDWGELCKIAKVHSVMSMIARQVLKLENVPADKKALFNNELLFGVYAENKQRTITKMILDDFEEAGIDCMALKGSHLRYMYPSPDMRSMGDIDILIHDADYAKAKPILEKYSLEFVTDSDHEYIFELKNSPVMVELHKLIVPDYNKELYSYYGDGWKFAKKEEGYNHRHVMKNEDFFVYNVVHSAKHYLNAGIGIRQVADLYVMINNEMYEKMDKGYVDAQFEILGIKEFYYNLVRLSKVWFGKETGDDITEIMGEHILNSGVFGTTEDMASSRAYRESNDTNLGLLRTKKAFKAVFLKPKDLKLKYKKLEKYPSLYPFYMVYRWFDALFNRKDNIKTNLTHIAVSKDNIKTFGDHCEAVGLRRTM